MVILEIYWDNGKYNANCYLGFGVSDFGYGISDLRLALGLGFRILGFGV